MIMKVRWEQLRTSYGRRGRVQLVAALLLLGVGPATAATTPPDPPLSKEDHTRIVYVIVANAAQVRRKVEVQRPTGIEVLMAALKVEAIDSYTKARIETVLR